MSKGINPKKRELVVFIFDSWDVDISEHFNELRKSGRRWNTYCPMAIFHTAEDKTMEYTDWIKTKMDVDKYKIGWILHISNNQNPLEFIDLYGKSFKSCTIIDKTRLGTLIHN